jgi:hypothetical protein
MKKLIVFCLLLISINLSAQIENEIRAFVDSSEVMISNGRRLLVKKLVYGDLIKANEIYSYLVLVPDGTDIRAFSYTEDLYINLLLHNYPVWIDKAMSYSNISQNYNNEQDDNITSCLYDLIIQRNKELSTDIGNADITQEEKELLKIFLSLVTMDLPEEIFDYQIEDFKKKYPDSKFNDFLKNYMPKSQGKSSTAYGMGASGIFLTGELGKSFSNNAVFNLNWDINISKLYASLYFQVGGLQVKRPFYTTSSIDTLNFENGESFDYFEGGLLFGYFLVRNKWLHIAPYTGILGTSLMSNVFPDPEDDDFELKAINAFTVGLGLKTEFKLYEYEMRNFYGNEYGQPAYFSLKLEGGYNIITKQEIDIFEGNIAYVKAAIMWGFGRF